MNTVYKPQRGGEIHLRPVSQYDVMDVLHVTRERFDEEHEEAPCPTFDIVLGGGELGDAGAQRVEHTEQSIADASEEDIESWNKYKVRQEEWRRDKFTATAEVLLCDGVVENPPEDGDWRAKYDRRGIVIPEDLDKLKVFWIERQVVIGPSELLELIGAIQQAAQGEVLKAANVAAETFRDSLGEQSGSDAGSDSSTTSATE